MKLKNNIFKLIKFYLVYYFSILIVFLATSLILEFPERSILWLIIYPIFLMLFLSIVQYVSMRRYQFSFTEYLIKGQISRALDLQDNSNSLNVPELIQQIEKLTHSKVDKQMEDQLIFKNRGNFFEPAMLYIIERSSGQSLITISSKPRWTIFDFGTSAKAVENIYQLLLDKLKH
ncbi:MAG: hypothetical protein IPH93_06875 [Saprospiraceae bacterium]|nr:hypothetical protein [Saprospiraceae bacterium]MBK7811199.1 hypothetical protein [Saprospiraceae bacterium]MBK9631097.1 hypothetical protein [Saprospiraceae bacterium]